MLIHHAEAEPSRVLRLRDADLASIDEEAAFLRAVVAEQAFDERRLARPVLAE